MIGFALVAYMGWILMVCCIQHFKEVKHGKF